jgi:hypothetical protein
MQMCMCSLSLTYPPRSPAELQGKQPPQGSLRDRIILANGVVKRRSLDIPSEMQPRMVVSSALCGCVEHVLVMAIMHPFTLHMPICPWPCVLLSLYQTSRDSACSAVLPCTSTGCQHAKGPPCQC